NRGRISGAAVEQLADNPLPDGAIREVYKGREPGDHMQNFFECVAERDTPISDVFTHHRALSTCHLANIAIRLGRPLHWDATTQQIVADDEANGWLKRKQRAGYEVA
ncbi:MAG: gfo/Idh/MocA family oxidoreductase, partial [Planctomycetales bacterium]|nr:gfo/Idh/MocA family oxidoreductase [Planctomycetales bacterium]